MIVNIGIFLISSFLITLGCIPTIKLIANKYRKYLKKSFVFKFESTPIRRNSNLIEEKKSKKLVRLGGMGLLVSFLICNILFNKFFPIIGSESIYLTIIVGSIIFSLIGFIDDIYILSPWPRLFLQTLTSIYVWSGGVRISGFSNYFYGPLQGDLEFGTLTSVCITTLFIVGITNAINWLDGLDGLAAGVISISSFGLLILSFPSGSFCNIFLISLILSSSLGFLVFNSYPASIFMGDCGSYFLGFGIAVLNITINNDINNSVSFFPFTLILGLPILDMLVVIFKRIFQKKSPFYPDQNHLHYKLLFSGFNHKDSVIMIYAIHCLLISLAVLKVNILWTLLFLLIAIIMTLRLNKIQQIIVGIFKNK